MIKKSLIIILVIGLIIVSLKALDISKNAEGKTVATSTPDLIFENNITTWASSYIYEGNGDFKVFASSTPDGGYIIVDNVYDHKTYTNILVIKIDSSGKVQWSKKYGRKGNFNYARFFAPTSDGGYIFVGETYNSLLYSDKGILAFKIDDDGNLQWAKRYSAVGDQYVVHFSALPDGNYVVLASGPVILKFNSFGDLQWSKKFAIEESYVFGYIRPTLDNGYMIFSYNSSYSNGNFLIFKLDYDGNFQWAKAYGKYRNGYIKSVFVDSDGGYIVFGIYGGNSYSPASKSKMMVFKIDSLGTLKWSRVYYYDKCYDFERYGSVMKTSDGGYLIAGNTCPRDYVNTRGNADLLLIKLDSLANLQWAKIYKQGRDTDIVFSDFSLTSDGGYLIGGVIDDFSGNNRVLSGERLLILKVDSLGNLQWARRHNLSYMGFINHIFQTLDGGYVIIGKDSRLETWESVYFVKLNSFGYVDSSSVVGSISIKSSYYNLFSKDYDLSTKDRPLLVSTFSLSVSPVSSSSFVFRQLCYYKEKSPRNNKIATWIKAFIKEEIAINSSVLTSDGGYILVGTQYNPRSKHNLVDILVIKLDSFGDIQWAKIYWGKDLERGHYITKTSDGGYIIAGNTDSYGSGNYDILILKLDSSGNIQWAKTYRGENFNYIRSILPTSDGGYIAIGSAMDSNNIENILTIKLSSTGNLQWAKTYGSGSSTFANFIFQAPDNGYVVGGKVGSDIVVGGKGVRDILTNDSNDSTLFFKLDPSGKIEWAKLYLESSKDDKYALKSISSAPDGGYIFVGDIINLRSDDNNKILIVKLDPLGNLEWGKKYGEEQGANIGSFSIFSTLDGGYVVSGYIFYDKFRRNNNLDFIMKINSIGDIKWIKKYSGLANDGFYESLSIFEDNDNNFMVAMTREREILIFKLDSLGNIYNCYLGGSIKLLTSKFSLAKATSSLPISRDYKLSSTSYKVTVDSFTSSTFYH